PTTCQYLDHQLRVVNGRHHKLPYESLMGSPASDSQAEEFPAALDLGSRVSIVLVATMGNRKLFEATHELPRWHISPQGYIRQKIFHSLFLFTEWVLMDLTDQVSAAWCERSERPRQLQTG